MARTSGKLSEKKVSAWFSAMNFDQQRAILAGLAEVHGKTRDAKIHALRRELADLEGGVSAIVRRKPNRRKPNGMAKSARRGSRKGAVKAKFRDPKSGETWSGRGRMARWLAERVKAGEKADKYLV